MMTEEPENMHPDIDTPWGPVQSAPHAAASEAGEVELPADWKYWLIDGARILRTSGNTMHADRMDALAAALTTQGGAEG